MNVITKTGWTSVVVMVLLCFQSWFVASVYGADDVQTQAMNQDPEELLEVAPVEELKQVPVQQDNTPSEGSFEKESESKSKDTPYPVATWTPDPVPVQTPVASGAVYKADHISPYYFSAYTPELDQTEVDLGLFLSDNPGINVSIGWGALEELMLSAQMMVQGASYTAGCRLQYQFREETDQEIKPALSVALGWRVQNHRTNNDLRETIFRGNRIYSGVTMSKSLGALANGLEGEKALVDFLNYLRFHVEALAEFQTGRQNATEDELSRLEFGIRAALEMVISPKRIYATIGYDSIPDWLNQENQYVAIRYYPREDFAVDVVGGWVGNYTGVTLGLAWFF